MSKPIDPNIARWFEQVDKTRTGRLNATELQEALKNNNYSSFDINVVAAMIDMFDKDRTKTINLNEFQELWNFLGSWRQCFDRFDNDRSGQIDAGELGTALTQLGYRFSQHFVPVLMQKFDYSGKAQNLQFDGFVMALIKIQRLTTAFQPYDRARNGSATFTYEQFLATVIQNTI